MRQFNVDSCAQRGTMGFICLDCECLGLCLQRNGIWEVIPIETCDVAKGIFCNTLLGTCSNQTGSCNPNLGRFICTSPGIYPDPYDCQAYHVCYLNGNNLIAADLECNAGTAFNPATGDCSLLATPEFCNEYPYKCENAGDTGAWRMNPQIFYVCIVTNAGGQRVLSPTLYRCPPMQHYDGRMCVPDGVISTPPSVGFKCPGTGLYADNSSCQHYFYCDLSLQPQRLRCPDGTRFDVRLAACVLGSC